MSGGCRIGRTTYCRSDSTSLWEVGTPTRLWWSCQAELEERIGVEVGEVAWEENLHNIERIWRRVQTIQGQLLKEPIRCDGDLCAATGKIFKS